jgi:hypothetical protein
MEKIVWAIMRASRGETQFADGAWDGSEIGATCFDLYWDRRQADPGLPRLRPGRLVEVQGVDDPHDFQRVYRSWDVPLSSLLAEYAGKTVDGTPDGDPVRVGDIEASHSGGGVAMVTVVQLCDREKAVRFIPSCNVKLYEYTPQLRLRPLRRHPEHRAVPRSLGLVGLRVRPRDLRQVHRQPLLARGRHPPRRRQRHLHREGDRPEPRPHQADPRRGWRHPVEARRRPRTRPASEVPAFEGEHAARAMELFKMLGFAPDAAWGSGFSGSGTDRGLMLQPLVEFTAMKQMNWEAGLGRLFSMAYRMIEAR